MKNAIGLTARIFILATITTLVLSAAIWLASNMTSEVAWGAGGLIVGVIAGVLSTIKGGQPQAKFRGGKTALPREFDKWQSTPHEPTT